jgi:hypothetical protein
MITAFEVVFVEVHITYGHSLMDAQVSELKLELRLKFVVFLLIAAMNTPIVNPTVEICNQLATYYAFVFT